MSKADTMTIHQIKKSNEYNVLLVTDDTDYFHLCVLVFIKAIRGNTMINPTSLGHSTIDENARTSYTLGSLYISMD